MNQRLMEFKRRVTNPPMKESVHLTPLEFGIVLGLTNYKNRAEEGEWRQMKEILKEKDFAGRPLFTSDKRNFPKYARALRTKGVIQRRLKEYKDNRNRICHRIEFRLKQDPVSIIRVHNLIINRLLSNRNLYGQNIRKDDIEKRSYFGGMDLSRGNLIQKRIEYYKAEIHRLELLKGLISIRTKGGY